MRPERKKFKPRLHRYRVDSTYKLTIHLDFAASDVVYEHNMDAAQSRIEAFAGDSLTTLRALLAQIPGTEGTSMCINGVRVHTVKREKEDADGNT